MQMYALMNDLYFIYSYEYSQGGLDIHADKERAF